MYKLLITLLLLLGCSSEGHSTNNIIDTLTVKADMYASMLDIKAVLDRCDYSTFAGLYNYSVPKRHRVSMDELEYPEGIWHRNSTLCYPDEARSEISLESMLGNLRWMYVTRNKEQLTRFIAIANKNLWVLGEGPKEYTWLPQLWIVTNKLNNVIVNQLSLLTPDTWTEGYRPNVIASFFELIGDIDGSLGTAYIKVVKILAEAKPNNPILQAIVHKYTDGDFAAVLSTLNDKILFPSYELPQADLSIFHWQAAHSAILYLYTLRIIRGNHDY